MDGKFITSAKSKRHAELSILHVFDMDGTLLRGTTASIEIARALGRLQELIELEQTFSAGEIDTFGFAKKLLHIWHSLTPDIVLNAVENAPWINGMCEVFIDIHEHGEHSMVITMSPDFFANHLMLMGVDVVMASRFPSLPFKEELDTASILTPQNKVSIVENILSAKYLSPVDCIAYGDSVSDIPLFQYIKNTISVNGDSQITPWAGIHYHGEDLREAYTLARARYIDGKNSAH